jgi:hypothetical protein
MYVLSAADFGASEKSPRLREGLFLAHKPIFNEAASHGFWVTES